jgi:hypothetical protein
LAVPTGRTLEMRWVWKVAICVGVGALWGWSSHALLKGLPSQEQVVASEEGGAAFGASSTNERCVIEALARGVACRDESSCEFLTADFLRGCLPASQATSGFCDGVPPSGDVIGGQAWSSRFWEAHGRPHHGGIVADDPVREFCHPEKMARAQQPVAKNPAQTAAQGRRQGKLE